MNETQTTTLDINLAIITDCCHAMGRLSRQLLDQAIETSNPSESIALDHDARTVARIAITIRQLARQLQPAAVAE